MANIAEILQRVLQGQAPQLPAPVAQLPGRMPVLPAQEIVAQGHGIIGQPAQEIVAQPRRVGQVPEAPAFNLFENVKIYKTVSNEEMINTLTRIYLDEGVHYYTQEMVRFVKWALKDTDTWNWVIDRTKDIIPLYGEVSDYDKLIGAIYSIGMAGQLFEITNILNKKYMRAMREVLP